MDNRKSSGVAGPFQSKRKTFGPQQTILQPPKGYVPPLRNELQPTGVYDTKTGYWVGLPIEALVEALVHAEMLNPVGKVDSRNAITLTIPAGTAVGVYGTTSELAVPSDEVWYLSHVVLDVPAPSVGDFYANFRVSEWPDAAVAAGRLFWPANQGPGLDQFAAECYQAAPLFATWGADWAGRLGTPIRLGPGGKLTLVGEVQAAGPTGVDRTITLTPYGWKGKRLVE